MTGRRKWARTARWVARAWSAVSVSLVIGFIVGEGVHPSGPGEWIGFIFFPGGITIGMILAWWKEDLGGVITAASLITFYLVRLATAGSFPGGLAWFAFAAPGFLFLLSWLLHRGG